MFKRKIWTEQRRYYIPAYEGKITGISHDNILKLANGYTIIELKSQFGDIKTQGVLGDATDGS